jgi:hypothetical protein
VVAELVRRGFGISPLPQDVAMIAPELECVLPDLDPIRHVSRRIRQASVSAPRAAREWRNPS